MTVSSEVEVEAEEGDELFSDSLVLLVSVALVGVDNELASSPLPFVVLEVGGVHFFK